MPKLYRRGKVWYTFRNIKKLRDGKPYWSKEWIPLDEDEDEATIKLGRKIEQWKAEKYERVKPADMPWEDFCKEYFRRMIAEKTHESLQRDRFIIKRFNSLCPIYNIKEYTESKLIDFKVFRSKQVKPSTVNRELNTLFSMARLAHRWGHLKENPATHVEPFPIIKAPPKPYTKREKSLLRDQAYDSFERVTHSLNFMQGLRRSEMCRLQWSDVYFAAKKLKIRSKKGGSGNKEGREIPLHKVTAQDLMEHRKENPKAQFVLELSGEPITDYKALSKIWDRMAYRANVPTGIHRGRHYFGNTLVNYRKKHIPLTTVSELMGHSRTSTTEGYVHQDGRIKRDAINIL